MRRNRHDFRFSQLSAASKGATMLEFAICFPILIAITIVLLDFSRYLAVQAVLQNSAQRALALAVTLPGIESDDQTSTDFVEANQKVIDEAMTLATSFVGQRPGGSMQYLIADSAITFDLPAAQPGQSMKNLLAEQPIALRLRRRLFLFFRLSF